MQAAWRSNNLTLAFSTSCQASNGNNRMRRYADLHDFCKHLLLKYQLHELTSGCWQLHRH